MSLYHQRGMLLCLLIILHDIYATAKPPRQRRRTLVKLKQGKLTGTFRTSDDGQFAWREYRGIPYARSPEGARRWKPPQSHQGWRGVYKAQGVEICPQAVPNVKNSFGTQTEDCLRLDVYVPARPTGMCEPMPVMVYIHGGAFKSGEKTLYNGAALSRKGVVVVNINYRLGILGFLSTGDDAAPGNFGLLDQQMAIKWVRDNIDRFGGDKKKITIFGRSAGAASVTFQMIANDGLFQRGIAESGSAQSVWALDIQGEVKTLTDSVLKALGCSDYTVSERKMQCLRKIDLYNLTHVDISRSLRGFIPVIDGAFISGSVKDLIKRFSRSNVQFMTGFVHSDGLQWAPFIPQFVGNIRWMYNAAVAEVVKFVYSEFLAAYENDPTNIQSLIGASEFVTDWFFASPCDKDARSHTSKGGVTYKYYFRYASGLPMIPNLPPFAHGTHGEQTALVFGFPSMPEITPEVYGFRGLTKVSEWKITPADREVSENIIKMWTNFAKTGDPNRGEELPGFTWKPYPNVLQIDEHLRESGTNNAPEELRHRKISLWNKLVPQLMKSCSGPSQ